MDIHRARSGWGRSPPPSKTDTPNSPNASTPSDEILEHIFAELVSQLGPMGE
jgi:hypothetical protein